MSDEFNAANMTARKWYCIRSTSVVGEVTRITALVSLYVGTHMRRVMTARKWYCIRSTSVVGEVTRITALVSLYVRTHMRRVMVEI